MTIEQGREVHDTQGHLLGRVEAEEGDYIKLADEHGKHVWVPVTILSDSGELIVDQTLDQKAGILNTDPTIDSDISNVDESMQESFPASDPPSFTPER